MTRDTFRVGTIVIVPVLPELVEILPVILAAPRWIAPEEISPEGENVVGAVLRPIRICKLKTKASTATMATLLEA